MSIIGTFRPVADGYVGQLRTLTLRRRVRIAVNEQGACSYGRRPEFRLLCGDTVIGAGWRTVTKCGRACLSIQIDDPSWPQPLRARLFETDGDAQLVWKRT